GIFIGSGCQFKLIHCSARPALSPCPVPRAFHFNVPLPYSNNSQMKKRPTSAVGYKRPISQYARVAMAMGSHPRYRAENIMFLELDVSPPAVFEMEFSHDQDQDPRALHMERLMRLDSFLERPSTSKVRKSRSWCQSPQRPAPSATPASLAPAALRPRQC
uniref:Kinesin family member 3C n=1 Tax=Sus scrofa TaxID=9823 RepID=A0A4X1SXH4_PIG